MMGRREFVTVLGGMAAWPVVGRAQQPGERMRRIGVFVSVADDSEGQTRIAAFLQALQLLGWAEGRNVRIDTRWGAGDPDLFRRYAAELVAPRARRHSGLWRLGYGRDAASDPHCAGRVRAGHRPSWEESRTGARE
jgi:hypothetical protein